ncbi:MAG TPA: aromatic acid exporter family protein [Bacilli bacterium]|nr:aromatic acid exporter family protein [Bacilli bacterium]
MEKSLRITLLLKMIIGFTAAYLIGTLFNVNYSYTAGVITVLSLALTKEAVLKQALARFTASLIGIGLGVLFFFLLGYEIYVLIIVVILLTTILYALKLEIGIVLALVLISQEYLGGAPSYALNALFVLIIGVGVAIILNFYTPSDKKVVDTNQNKIDQQISDVFHSLAKNEGVDFSPLKSAINQAKKELILAKENRSFKDVEKRISYLGMRESQTLVLERVNHILIALGESVYKTKVLNYLFSFVGHIGKVDNATRLLNDLLLLHQEYDTLALPKTRLEFEQRAELYHVLSELQSFLEAKIDYHHKYDLT